MKLFEFQAKKLFETYGIAIPKSVLIEQPSEIDKACQESGLPCVLKAQVLHGGRGKRNLVVWARDLKEAKTEGERIYNQTGATMLIEKAVNIKKEIYLSFTLEPISGSHLLMMSAEGGIDIEQLAKENPEKIIKRRINPFIGLLGHEANELVYELNIEDIDVAKKLARVLPKIYQVFASEEASLVEINPLVISMEDEILALDGKMDLDDSAMYRHTAYPITRRHYEHQIEYEAAEEGIPYIQFDGDIGMMVAGAGLANVVFDLIHHHGGTVANYLEFGGPNYRKGKKCMEMMLRSKPKCVLIATFGTIARADVMAAGIVEAVKEYKPNLPLFCSIKGTGEEEAERLLNSVGLELITDTEEAVEKAVAFIRR